MKKHMGGQIARLGLADYAAIKESLPQLLLRGEDTSAEIFRKGCRVPRFLASTFRHRFPFSTSILAGPRRRNDGKWAAPFDSMPTPLRVKSWLTGEERSVAGLATL